MLEYKLVFDWLSSIDKDEFVSACRELYEQEIQSFTKESLIAAYHDYDFKDSIPDMLPTFDETSGENKMILNMLVTAYICVLITVPHKDMQTKIHI